MEACHHNTLKDMDQWQGPITALRCTELFAARLMVVMQYAKAVQHEQLLWKPTFVVVVFNSEDSSPGGSYVIHDGLNVQRFDCEGVDDSDRDPLWKMS